MDKESKMIHVLKTLEGDFNAVCHVRGLARTFNTYEKMISKYHNCEIEVIETKIEGGCIVCKYKLK
jgi:hypothetical protein